LGPLGGDLFRAAPSPKPKLRLAAVAKRAAQPYDVFVLECPKPTDHFADLDPCPPISDAEADRAGDEAMPASPEAKWDDAVSVMQAVAWHLGLPDW
jgi:hypothetical protein